MNLHLCDGCGDLGSDMDFAVSTRYLSGKLSWWTGLPKVGSLRLVRHCLACRDLFFPPINFSTLRNEDLQPSANPILRLVKPPTWHQ